MDQLAEGLNAADHAGHQVFPLQHVAVDFNHTLPGGPGQVPQITIVSPPKPEFRYFLGSLPSFPSTSQGA